MKRIEFINNLKVIANEYADFKLELDEKYKIYQEVIASDNNLKETINLEELSDIKNFYNDLFNGVVLQYFHNDKDKENIVDGADILNVAQKTLSNLKSKLNTFELKANPAPEAGKISSKNEKVLETGNSMFYTGGIKNVPNVVPKPARLEKLTKEQNIKIYKENITTQQEQNQEIENER
ncbi:hypothetical protein [Spiroplasma melliferum]|uniref:hypothetical protein n=1 Tax=Spiroplasma melliferum TaxID=2134 RepID=UPI0002A62A07|nr:hypothetical protein [Spiroplasma melliferum]ELL44642.1 hypothetical protein SMIPMB4A_v3c3810 [Spiroplasma melliferum IPMB4A]